MIISLWQSILVGKRSLICFMSWWYKVFIGSINHSELGNRMPGPSFFQLVVVSLTCIPGICADIMWAFIQLYIHEMSVVLLAADIVNWNMMSQLTKAKYFRISRVLYWHFRYPIWRHAKQVTTGYFVDSGFRFLGMSNGWLEISRIKFLGFCSRRW